MSTRTDARPPEATEQTHVIEIPDWHPVPLNKLQGHWRARHRRKKAQTVMVRAYSFHIPPAIGKRRVRLRITLAPRQRGADPDAFWKGLLDSLKQCKLLVDDNRQGVEIAPVEYERGTAKATTIILEDLR